MLKKWSVDDHYIEVIRNAGNWQRSPGRSLQLLDLVNLALYHAIKQHSPSAELPPLEQLAAYQKLLPPQNFISENGELEVVVSHHDEIQAIAQTLR